MPNEKLSVLKIRNAKPRRGRRCELINDSRNLYLQVSIGPTGNIRRSWILRYRLGGGRTKDMGLGRTEDVGAAEARLMASEYRRLMLQGVDPLTHRNAARAANLVKTAAPSMTFDQCAAIYLRQHRSGWKSAIHMRQWENSMARYVSPVIGNLPVAEITTPIVLKVLEPIWQTKAVTASRIRQRIEAVLGWAGASGHRDVSNPARWSNHLDKLLASPTKLQKVKPQTALPYSEMPDLMTRLRERKVSIPALALQLCILTCVRSDDIRRAKWADIDLAAKLWIIPEFSKVGGVHKVPLSDAAVAVIERARKLANGGEFIFFNAETGAAMSPNAMLELLGRMDLAGKMTVHGCRASFRTFCQERASAPREIAEMCLGHVVGSKVERAYARSDLLEKRRGLMEAWARYLTEPEADKVVELRPRSA